MVAIVSERDRKPRLLLAPRFLLTEFQGSKAFSETREGGLLFLAFALGGRSLRVGGGGSGSGNRSGSESGRGDWARRKVSQDRAL